MTSVKLFPARAALARFDQTNPKPWPWAPRAARADFDARRQPLARDVITAALALQYTSEAAFELAAHKRLLPGWIGAPAILVALVGFVLPLDTAGRIIDAVRGSEPAS